MKESRLNVKRIAVVHGEKARSLAFCDFLKDEGLDAMVPRLGETLAV